MNKNMLPAVAMMLLVSSPAFAAGIAPESQGMVAMAAGLAIGIAALGGALGQGNAARAFYESVARNPQAAGALNGPFFVGMALIESLVIYALVIAFFLQGKI